MPIPDTVPGEEVDVSIDLTTSHLEGATQMHFKMADEHGNLSFPNRYIYGLILMVETRGAPRRMARRCSCRGLSQPQVK